MSEIKFMVPNISCMHCTSTIERELSELEGIEEVRATLEGKSVQVIFGPPATQQSIKDALEEINYPVAA